jgi:hypothetical protein
MEQPTASEPTASQPTAESLFGEPFGEYPLRTFPVRSMGNATGKGYYIGYPVDNTRRKYTAYRIAIVWDDGDVEYSTADSEDELKLWTEHLQ